MHPNVIFDINERLSFFALRSAHSPMAMAVPPMPMPYTFNRIPEKRENLLKFVRWFDAVSLDTHPHLLLLFMFRRMENKSIERRAELSRAELN